MINDDMIVVLRMSLRKINLVSPLLLPPLNLNFKDKKKSEFQRLITIYYVLQCGLTIVL